MPKAQDEEETQRVDDLKDLPLDWHSAEDEKLGKTYYYNAVTNATQWTPPKLGNTEAGLRVLLSGLSTKKDSVR